MGLDDMTKVVRVDRTGAGSGTEPWRLDGLEPLVRRQLVKSP